MFTPPFFWMLSSTWSIPSSTHPKARTWMPTKFFLLATAATRPRRAAAAAGALCWPPACVAACAPACGFVCEVACGVACDFASCAISAAVALASRRNVLRSRRDVHGIKLLRGRMGDAPTAQRVSRATFVPERIAAHALTKPRPAGNFSTDELFDPASRAPPSPCAQRVGGSVRCGEVARLTPGFQRPADAHTASGPFCCARTRCQGETPEAAVRSIRSRGS